MNSSDFEIDPYDPCPCGSGAKYKFCCAAKAKDRRHGKFPIGTVSLYGPDDRVTTKIAAGVNLYDGAEPIMERWVAPDVTTSPKVLAEIKRFFASYGVKNVVMTSGNIGCPHEEKEDFPLGEDCPFCPFWAGKQGTARRDDGDGFPPGVSVNEAPHLAGDRAYGDDDGEEDDDQIDDEFDGAEDDESDGAFSEEQFARVGLISGDEEAPIKLQLERWFAHLQTHLDLPCEVTGTGCFRWEEPYFMDLWPKEEREPLRNTQPCGEDHYELLEIDVSLRSPWSHKVWDIGARVRRLSDDREFVLGLSDLKATDKRSPNFQPLDDFEAWIIYLN